jgi:hypothetical protein
MTPTAVFDLEVYSNYTLLVFKDVEKKWVTRHELPLTESALDDIRGIVTQQRLITFNGTGYDIPLLHLILRGEPSEKIKKASDRIIVQGLTWWNFEKEFNVTLNGGEIDHIDLMPVAPLTGGLKLYGARMHSRSIQDLPVAPSAMITDEQKLILREYCENDCDNTIDLFNALRPAIELREKMSAEFMVDLRSKSDAQMAEAILKVEIERRTKSKLQKSGMGSGDRFYYQPPAWVTFRTSELRAALDVVKATPWCIADSGHILLSIELLQRKIVVGGKPYSMGVGGLHSNEKKQVVKADDEHVLIDMDVASYYPSIALNLGLYPKHIGPVFLHVYQDLVNRRLEAKKLAQELEKEPSNSRTATVRLRDAKAVNEGLKISANGTFGKLASKFSVLYSPDLLVAITLTGQMALLMLIEALDDIFFVEVCSANTDGVTIRCPKSIEPLVLEAVKEWEAKTGFTMERTDYAAVYSRDVSNYIALKTDGSVKTKGEYGSGLLLHKNPYQAICSRAVIDHLLFDADIAATITECQDIRQFLCVRSVKGGATYHGDPIGKVVRWYYSTQEEEALLYKTNGYLVPKSLHARPCVVLPDAIPEDLDRQYYITEAYSMLADLGVAI